MTASRRSAERSGFALPAAIMALVLLSALVAGTLFVSTEELRAGRSDLAGEHALAAAELALDRAIASWDARLNTSLAIGARTVIERTAVTATESVTVVAMRVQPRAVWLTSQATSNRDGRTVPARRALGASMRLVSPVLPVAAALTAAGRVVVDGGTVDGTNASAAGRDTTLCDEVAPADAAGVAAPDPAQVCGVACGVIPPGIAGNPPIDSLGSLTSDSARQAATDSARSAFAQRATVVLAGGRLAPRPTIVAGQCDRTDPLNWGDPSRATICADRYVVIHVSGSAVLAAGSVGQGVLIVDGALSLEAGARFAGIVIAGGAIQVAGVGADIAGVVFAGGADPTASSRIVDGGGIRYASCAVRRALLGTSRLVRTPVRWWAELR